MWCAVYLRVDAGSVGISRHRDGRAKQDDRAEGAAGATARPLTMHCCAPRPGPCFIRFRPMRSFQVRTGVHEFQQVAKNVVAIIGITKVLSVLMGVERLVQFRSDGLGLSPGEYARLLGEIVATRGICTDDYSCGGVVAELEAKMATLLGQEAAVFLPTGTLANHLAVRLLARTGRRVLVQAESHLWNDEGDCAQTLSGLTLVPLAPGRATVSLAEIQTAVAGAPGMRVAVPVGAISIETPVRRVAGGGAGV